MTDKVDTKPFDVSFSIADQTQIPNDTVQVLKFCPTNSTVFAAGCWDETVRIYQLNIQGNSGVRSIVQQASVNVGSPVIDMMWHQNGQAIFVATGDSHSNILFLPLTSANPTPGPIGLHQDLVCFSFAQVMNIDFLITAGLDKQLAFWMNTNGNWERKINIPLPKFPTSMDVDMISGFILLGLECDLGIYMLDKLQKGDTSIQIVELLLKSPISCVKVRDKAQDTEGLFKQHERAMVACGSDGRIWYGEVKMSNFSKEDKILFKAHAKKQNLFPITGVGFSKVTHHSMYTISADGCLFFWDVVKKNKLTGYTVGDGIPITAADISPDQQFLAVAVGYDWSQGAWGAGKCKIRPRIFIHMMTQNDHKRTGK
jgi:WD40 repeat protein